MRAPDALRSVEIEHRTAAEYWDMFRFGPSEGFEKRQCYPDSQFPAAEAFDWLINSQSARRHGEEQYSVEVKGIVEVLKTLGKCHVIAHSKGAALSVLAANQVPHLIDKLVLLEPAARLGNKVLTQGFSPALLIWGDHMSESKIWTRIRETNAELSQAQQVETWDLPVMGIRGNSHFLINDNNSEQIMELVYAWLKK